MRTAMVAMCASLLAAGCGSGDRPAGSMEAAWLVVGVLDGDTFDVRGPDREEERVRLIGINAPESGECFGDEATEALHDLISGEDVELIWDRSDRDRHDRLLRYVESAGDDIGHTMVGSGHAIARRYPPDTARADAYDDAQASAEKARAGMWAPDACGTSRVEDHTLVFGAVRFDADGPDLQNLNDEWVRLDNRGEETVELSGWTVRDESASNRYTFPAGFRLERDASVTLRTGCGTDDRENLHWCQSGAAVWNNDGDTAFLLDPEGNIVATTEG